MGELIEKKTDVDKLHEEDAPHPWRDRFLNSIGPLWILCGVTSYSLLTLTCRRFLHNEEALPLLRREVDRSIQERSATIFCTALAIDIISLLFEGQTTKLDFVLFPAFIKCMASTTNLLTLFGGSVLGITPMAGRVVLLQRYICWMHTTPSILMLMKLISKSITTREAVFVILCDEAMIVTGAIASLSSGWSFVFWTFMTHITMLPIFPYLHKAFSEAISATQTGSIRITMWTVYGFMMTLWCAFAVNWDLAALGLISIQTEEILYLCCDFSAKVLFSSTLMLSSFKGMEARRVVAMRSIEELSKQKLIEELKRTLEQKERFLSSVSHELKTPLNGIIGISEGMLSGCCGVLTDQVRRQVFILRTSGARLLTLINDMMDASALMQNKLRIASKEVVLRQVVDDVLDLSHGLVRPSVELRNVVPSSLLVLGDPVRIVQILNNLISNAAKSTLRGQIKISARLVAAGRQVAITVADTGVGIPQSKLGAIFLPFEQLDVSSSRKSSNFGLGLNIVQELVKVHGGDISVDSTVGHGSRFTFTLPAAPALDTHNDRISSSNSTTSEEVSGSLAQGMHPSSRAASTLSRVVSGGAVANSSAVTSPTALPTSPPRNRGAGGVHTLLSSVATANANAASSAAATASAFSAGVSGAGLRKLVGSRRGASSTGATLDSPSSGGTTTASGTAAASSGGTGGPGGTLASGFHRISAGRSAADGGVGGGAGQYGTTTTGGTAGQDSLVLAQEGSLDTLLPIEGSEEFSQPNGQRVSRSMDQPAARDGVNPLSDFQVLQYNAAELAALGSFAFKSQDAGSSPAVSSLMAPIHGGSGPLLMSVSADEESHALMVAMLADVNLRVLAMLSGEAALVYLETCEELPDIILCDVHLPGGMGGWNVVREIRVLVPSTHIPVVMMLPMEPLEGEDGIAAHCLECGADEFVFRPVERPTLLACLTSLIGIPDHDSSVSVSEPGGAVPDVTILCVDDDTINQSVLHNMLRSMVFKQGDSTRHCRYVRMATSAEVLTYFASDAPPPDLVLLNNSLPDISGVAICRHIRQIHNRHQVPIIMISSRHNTQGVEEALLAGANDYLTKPVRRWELSVRLKMHLQLMVVSTPSGGGMNAARLPKPLLQSQALLQAPPPQMQPEQQQEQGLQTLHQTSVPKPQLQQPYILHHPFGFHSAPGGVNGDLVGELDGADGLGHADVAHVDGGLSPTSNPRVFWCPTSTTFQAPVLVVAVSDYSTLCRACSPLLLQGVLGQLNDIVTRLAQQFGLVQVDTDLSEDSIALMPDAASADSLQQAVELQYRAARLLVAAATHIALPGDVPLYVQLCLHVAVRSVTPGLSLAEDHAILTDDAIQLARDGSALAPLMGLLVTEPALPLVQGAGFGGLIEYHLDGSEHELDNGSIDESFPCRLWLVEG